MQKQTAFKASVAALVGAMTLASVSPAMAQSYRSYDDHRGAAQYQDHRNDRLSEREHRRLHQRDIYHAPTRYDRTQNFEREHRQWERYRSQTRYQNYSQYQDPRTQYRIDSSGAAFTALAGLAIGAIIVRDNDRRQYYRDRNTDRHYYYSYNDRQYYWDPNYRAR